MTTTSHALAEQAIGRAMRNNPHDTRKLLELAAKAAGLTVKIWDGHTGPMCAIDDDRHGTMWMPHHNYGVALQLALKLNMILELSSGDFQYCEARNEEHDRIGYADINDAENYVCLAILRAAAAIGEAMP